MSSYVKGLSILVVSLMVLGLLPMMGPAGGQTTAPSYDKDYSDPASDVEWSYENGTTDLKDGPKDLNLKRLRSEDKGDEIMIRLEVVSPGRIKLDPNATYSILIALVNDSVANLVIEFNNGDCVMKNDTTGVMLETETTCEVMEGARQRGEVLRFKVPKQELGGPQYYEVAGKVKFWEEKDDLGNVTYTDYIWTLSGNPGSTPEDPPTSDKKDSNDYSLQMTVLLAGIIVASIVVIGAAMYREMRR